MFPGVDYFRLLGPSLGYVKLRIELKKLLRAINGRRRICAGGIYARARVHMRCNRGGGGDCGDSAAAPAGHPRGERTVTFVALVSGMPVSAVRLLPLVAAGLVCITGFVSGIHVISNRRQPGSRRVLHSNRRGEYPRYRGKRLLDLTIVTLVALPAIVIGIVAAMAILLEDGGPVLFRQVRIGRNGRQFVLLKLRTMTSIKRSKDAFPDSQDFTRIGRLLRRLSIDELPQLINVLRGEMSIVGPRPTLPYQVQRYDSRQFGRLRVLPGLTGLAQVNGRNKMTWPVRIEWDLQYVASQSLWLDLKILVRTVKAILVGAGVAGHSRNDPIAHV
jgi:sugar transferase EpsL